MKRKILSVILVSLIAVSGFSQTNSPPAATVNLIRVEAITVGQLRSEVERAERSAGRSLTREERLQVLDLMINERLFLQAAERDSIRVIENDLNQQIQEFRNNMAQQIGRQPTEAEFAYAVREQTGLDVPTFREETRKQMIMQRLLFSKKGDLLNSVRQPTEAEIVNQYNLLRSRLIRPETVRFSMIQVPYGPDAASRARARTLADSLFREIGSSPSKFDEVAARSVTPNSGYQAGDAGYLPRDPDAQNVVGQNFMNTAFSLRQGQVSGLIEGIQGFQIIKVTENYTQMNLGLDDILQLGTRITVREYIRQMLLNERQQAINAQASQELITELRAGRSFQIFENNLNW